MAQDKGWIYSFFGSGDNKDFYGNVYQEMGVFDRKDTEKEIDGVLKMLKLKPGSHILDWCGGWGRHAIPLAKRGFEITLLDFSSKYLGRAWHYAEQEAVSLKRVCEDFRETPESIQADYAVNLFTAGLGYLGEENDVIALKSLFRALKPGARIIIDTMSLFWIARNFQTSNWDVSVDGKKKYLQKRSFDFLSNTEFATNTFLNSELNTEETRNVELKIYCPADLSRVLKMAGFVPQELFGGFDASEFSFSSKRLVMTAQKPF